MQDYFVTNTTIKFSLNIHIWWKSYNEEKQRGCDFMEDSGVYCIYV